MDNNVPVLLNDVAITVIKDQYCYQGHRFNETEVLRHIYAEEEIPTIVHIAHSEDVFSYLFCRQKKRIEYGKPFMNLKTLLEALKQSMIYLKVSLKLTYLPSF